MNKQLFYIITSLALITFSIIPQSAEAHHAVKPSIKCDQGKIKINLSLPALQTKFAKYNVYKNGVYVRSTQGNFTDKDQISTDQGLINYRVVREEGDKLIQIEEVKVDPRSTQCTSQAPASPDSWVTQLINLTKGTPDEYQEILNPPVTPPEIPPQLQSANTKSFAQLVNDYCNDPKILEVLQKTCKEDSYKLCNPDELGHIDIGCVANIKLRTQKANANSTSDDPREPANSSLGPELFEELLGYLCDSNYWGEATSKACSNHTLSRCVQNETREDFEKCVRSKFSRTHHKTYAQMQAERASGPTGPGGGRASVVLHTPALVGKVSDEFIRALGAWCSVQCPAEKKDACMDTVGTACEKNQDFKSCIEAEAKKFCPAPPIAQPPIPQQETPPQPSQPSATIKAYINGYQDTDFYNNVDQVTIAASVKVGNNDSCTKVVTKFELFQTHDERGNALNQLIPLSLDRNTTSCEGIKIDLGDKGLKLRPGQYELVVTPDNFPTALATFTLKSAAPTPTEAKVFSCTTIVKPEDVNSNEIKASVEGSHPSYDRINWYIGKEAVQFKGTNKIGDLTKFDVEPNSIYSVQAEYYSQDVSQKREAYKCVPKVGVKTPVAKQDRRVKKSNPRQLAAVLGTHTSPISFDVLPTVTPSSIVAVNIRVVALDNSGNEAENLFDEIWENARPLPITINNPSAVSAVKVTVELVDETNQFSPSKHTTYIPISSSEDQIDQIRQDVPQSFYLLTSPDLAVLEQSIRNGNSSITLIASSEYPVSDPSFSVNGEKVAPDSILCADKKLGPCGYHLILYAPFVGKYVINFEDKTVQFSAPEAVSEVSQKQQPEAEGGGGGVNRLVKITISQEDGTGAQVIYENGQFDPAEFANLTEGDNRLIITKQYSNGATKTDFLVVRRKTQSEKQQPEEEKPTQQVPQEPSGEAPPQQEPASPARGEPTLYQPTLSHRTCGDASGNVIVDVYSDGSEVAGTNCEDLAQVCQLFDNEGRQDAICVERQSTE